MTVMAEATKNGHIGGQGMTYQDKQRQHEKIASYLDSGQAAGQAVFEIYAALNGEINKSTIVRQMHKRGAGPGADGLLRMPGPGGAPAPRIRRGKQRGKQGGYLPQGEAWQRMNEALAGHKNLTAVQIHEITGVPMSTVYRLLAQHGVMLGEQPAGQEQPPAVHPAAGGTVYSPLQAVEAETVDAEIVDGPPLRQQYVDQLADGRFLGRDERGQVWIWRPDRPL